jgi:hypothetical protein
MQRLCLQGGAVTLAGMMHNADSHAGSLRYSGSVIVACSALRLGHRPCSTSLRAPRALCRRSPGSAFPWAGHRTRSGKLTVDSWQGLCMGRCFLTYQHVLLEMTARGIRVARARSAPNPFSTGGWHSPESCSLPQLCDFPSLPLSLATPAPTPLPAPPAPPRTSLGTPRA